MLMRRSDSEGGFAKGCATGINRDRAGNGCQQDGNDHGTEMRAKRLVCEGDADQEEDKGIRDEAKVLPKGFYCIAATRGYGTERAEVSHHDASNEGGKHAGN